MKSSEGLQVESRRPAPTPWIHELYGRKHGHGFNQVTAVSTTGFAAGAKEMAANMGVELRSISDASAADVSTWLAQRQPDLVLLGGSPTLQFSARSGGGFPSMRRSGSRD